MDKGTINHCVILLYVEKYGKMHSATSEFSILIARIWYMGRVEKNASKTQMHLSLRIFRCEIKKTQRFYSYFNKFLQ